MAASSKKNTTSKSKKRSGKQRKKPLKQVPKKRSRRKQRGYKRVWHIFIVVLGMSLLVGVGYCLGTCLDKETTHPYEKKNPSVATKVVKRYTPPKQKKEMKSVMKAKAKRQKLPTSYEKVRLAYRGKRPKLAIIIDDIHTSAQLHAVTTLPFPVTPSIFPPYLQSPRTDKLATQAVHYMVHLPMESGNAKYDRQSKTLKTTFSQKEIEARVHELRRFFPRAHYVNNHTGSQFTKNRHAMALLYKALKKEGFVFIDSLTTTQSKVREIAHHYGDAYVARDVFLDNKKEIGYIHTQLKKAVALARKHGFAIAIGHPHSITFKALRSAQWLPEEVEVVYIDALFRR